MKNDSNRDFGSGISRVFHKFPTRKKNVKENAQNRYYSPLLIYFYFKNSVTQKVKVLHSWSLEISQNNFRFQIYWTLLTQKTEKILESSLQLPERLSIQLWSFGGSRNLSQKLHSPNCTIENFKFSKDGRILTEKIKRNETLKKLKKNVGNQGFLKKISENHKNRFENFL